MPDSIDDSEPLEEYTGDTESFGAVEEALDGTGGLVDEAHVLEQPDARPGPFDRVNCPVCGRDVVSWVAPRSAFAVSKIELAGDPDHCQRGAAWFFHEANIELETMHGMRVSGDIDCLGEGDTLFEHTTMSNTNTDDKAPLADGATVHIHADDPLLVTRAGTTYHAWDIDDEGDPVGDPWALSEGAVRGLLGRYDWVKVEAQASVRGGDDE